jgi:hypothetical protein
LRKSNSCCSGRAWSGYSWFGGMEFIDALAPMRAVAVEESVFLRLPREAVLELMRRGVPLALHFVRGNHAAMCWLLGELEKSDA